MIDPQIHFDRELETFIEFQMTLMLCAVGGVAIFLWVMIVFSTQQIVREIREIKLLTQADDKK